MLDSRARLLSSTLRGICERARAGIASPDHHEETALGAQGAHPAELGQDAFRPPVVLGLREELVASRRTAVEERARVAAQVLDVIVTEPLLHFAERVAVLFR